MSPKFSQIHLFQEGFCGLWGRRVDSIEYYKQQVKDLDKKVDDYFQLTMGKLLDWQTLSY